MTIHRVVGLEGLADSGKSSVLRKVAKTLEKRANAKVKNVFRGSDYRKKGDRGLLKQDGDVTIVIEIDGRVVVVVTGGDKEDVVKRIKDLLDKLKVDVDVLVVAMRLGDVSNAYIKAFAGKLTRIFKIPCGRRKKVPLEHQVAFDDYYVREILRLVDEQGQ